MTESLNRDDAARSIEHVRRREQQVITATAIPLWYWWVVGAGTLVLGVVADGRRPAVIAVTAVLFGAATAALTLWVIPGAGSGARVSRDLLGGGGPASIVGSVGFVVLSGLAVAFWLRARGASGPATVGTAVTAAALVVGGPMLMAVLRPQMLCHGAIPPR